jgi:hypothetical protein
VVFRPNHIIHQRGGVGWVEQRETHRNERRQWVSLSSTHPTGILAPRRSKPQNAISTCTAGTITPSQTSPIKGEGSKESNDSRATPTAFAPSVIDYFQGSPADSDALESSTEEDLGLSPFFDPVDPI